MPKSSVDLSDLLGDRNLRVTPLLCIFHGGAIAKAASEAAASWPHGKYAHVIRFMSEASNDGKEESITADKAAKTCIGMFTADFRAKIQAHSLTLRIEAAPWIAIWCEGTPEIQKFAEDLREKLIHANPMFERSPIIIYADSLSELKNKELYKNEENLYKYKNTHWIVCGSESVLNQDATVRGRCTYAHLITSWQKYCELGLDSSLKVLGLSANHWAHDLGIGHDSPDTEWQIGRVSSLADAELLKQWLRPAESVAPPDFPSLKNLSNAILDETLYVATEEKDDTTTSILTPPDRILSAQAFLRMRPDTRQAELPGDADRRSWYEDRHTFGDFEIYLRLVLLIASQRQTIQAASRALDDLKERWINYFKPPAKPAGAIDDLKKQASYASNYAKALEESKGKTENAAPPLDQRLAEVDRAVLNVPARWGLFLRCALILIGVIWLSFGTFFWERGATPFSNMFLRWVLIGGVTGVLVLGAASAIKYHYSRKLVQTLLSRVIQDIRNRHLRDVCTVVVERLGGIGAALGKVVSLIGEQLDKVADALGKTLDIPSRIPENRSPHFGIRAAEKIWAKNQEEVLFLAHERTMSAVQAHQNGLFDPAVWSLEGKKACGCVSAGIINKLHYQDWCQLAELKEDDMRRIIERLLGDADQKTQRASRATNGMPIYIGPIQFVQMSKTLEDQKGHDETAQLLRHPALPWLIVVQPLPLLDTRIEEVTKS